MTTPPRSCSSRTTTPRARSSPTTSPPTATTLLVADCAPDGLRLLERKFPDLALVDLGLPDGQRLRAAAPRARAPTASSSRVDPRHAAAGAQRPRRRSSTACAASSAAPTTTSASRSPTPSCAAASRRCCGAPTAPRRHGACASASSRSTRARARSRLRGDRVELSQKEFALLRTLAADPTRVFTKEELLRSIWGFRATGLDAHAGLARLPAARASSASHGDRYVVNVWGVGYRLVDGAARRLAGGVIDAWRVCRALGRELGTLRRHTRGRGHDDDKGGWSVGGDRLGAGGGRLAAALARVRAAPPARARRARLPRAARAADRGAAGLARGAPPARRRPSALAALDLELRRAGLALDDLAAARSGRRVDRPHRAGRGRRAARGAVESWHAVAGAFDSRVAARRAAAGRARPRRPAAPRAGGRRTSSPTRSSTAPGASS